jgi:hypothetical protein
MKYSPTYGTVQHQLLGHLEKERKLLLEATLDPKHLAWWKSSVANESSKWIDIRPTGPAFVISNENFQTTLRYRAFLRALKHVDGLRCSCSSHPVLDPLGHHVSTGCGAGGYRIGTHNGVVRTLDGILHYCGHWTKLEERGVFHAADPDNNKRPDITVFNPPTGNAPRLLIDVSVTNPLVGFDYRVNHPVGYQASKVFSAKMTKFSADAENQRFSFLPFIFESTGYLHPEACKFLRLLAANASQTKRIPANRLYNFFVKRLLKSLHDGVAEAMVKRLGEVSSHCFAMAYDSTYSMEGIMESEE